jgi:hypothetical protein
VIDVLSDLFILRGVPSHIRSDNGPEFVAQAVRDWISAVGSKTAYIEPGITLGERVRGELQRPAPGRAAERRDLLQPAGGEIVIESWRRHYNTVRPHASLGYRPPAPEVLIPALTAWPAAPLEPLRRPGSRGATPHAALTFTPGHSMGADHHRVVARQCAAHKMRQLGSVSVTTKKLRPVIETAGRRKINVCRDPMDLG